MKLTENLKLKKPDYKDYVNVSDLNENMDTLDKEVGDLMQGSTTIKDLQTDNKTLVGAINELEKKKADKAYVDEGIAGINVPVKSVNDKIGDVTLKAGDVGAAPTNHGHAYEDISGKPRDFPPSKHTHVKADVGVGNVENYGVATTAEAQAGVADNKYMTPKKTMDAVVGGFGGMRKRVFTENGTWVVPPGVKEIYITACGGGGPDGGGGGACIIAKPYTVVPGQIKTITVGASGDITMTGVPLNGTLNYSNGGATIISDTVTLSGGSRAVSQVGAPGGAGGGYGHGGAGGGSLGDGGSLNSGAGIGGSGFPMPSQYAQAIAGGGAGGAGGGGGGSNYRIFSAGAGYGGGGGLQSPGGKGIAIIEW